MADEALDPTLGFETRTCLAIHTSTDPFESITP